MEHLNRELVKRAFKECKKAAGLDYSYSKGLGDCMSCTNAILADKFGIWSKGIWLKWFPVGMNSSKWENKKSAYIVHELTAEQAEIVKEILAKYFEFEWDGKTESCMLISPKKEKTEAVKPRITVKMNGPQGNIYAIMGQASGALRAVGDNEAADKIMPEITENAKSYKQALDIIRKYVELV